jgi:hypothetical protein
MRASRARDRLKKQIDTLVIRNLEKLHWETLQNINNAFRKFSNEVDTNLALTIEATHGTIRSALAQRKQHGESIADRM